MFFPKRNIFSGLGNLRNLGISLASFVFKEDLSSSKSNLLEEEEELLALFCIAVDEEVSHGMRDSLVCVSTFFGTAGEGRCIYGLVPKDDEDEDGGCLVCVASNA